MVPERLVALMQVAAERTLLSASLRVVRLYHYLVVVVGEVEVRSRDAAVVEMK